MDYSKKVNANAGKTARYRPGEVSQNFGEPNMAAPGAGISANAKIRSQQHGTGSASGMSRTDMSKEVRPVNDPGMSVENYGAHPAGVSGPSEAIAGKGVNRTMSMPGDDQPGRRGGPAGNSAPDRYRKRY